MQIAAGDYVMVTGITGGIGSSVAIRLGQEGHNVVGCYLHSSEKASTIAEKVRNFGVNCYVQACDVRDVDQVNQMFEHLDQASARVTGLVTAAGVDDGAPAHLTPMSQWNDMIASNLTGVWNVTHASLFSMLRQHSGSIVNISSLVGLYGYVGMAAYAASKAGVIGLTKSIAKEVAARNVRANVVAPGMTVTDTGNKHLSTDRARETHLTKIPMNRFADPMEIADAVVFLISDKSSYITGQTIEVSGGATF